MRGGLNVTATKRPSALQSAFTNLPLGSTAFMACAFHGLTDAMRTLVAQGADINHQNQLGQCALSLAVRGGQKSSVRFLVAHGADLALPDADGRYPLEYVRASRSGLDLGDNSHRAELCAAIVSALKSCHGEKRARYTHSLQRYVDAVGATRAFARR